MPGLLAPSHIIILGLVLLLIFGPKRLPEMGRSLGHGMREFKDSIAGDGEKNTAEQRPLMPAEQATGVHELDALEVEHDRDLVA